MNEGCARETYLRELWKASMAASSRLLSVPLTILAFAITAAASVAALLSVPADPVAFALTALLIAAVSTGFSVWRLMHARAGIAAFEALAGRFADVPPEPGATINTPAGLLQLDDAASVAQLDRILHHHRANWPEPDDAQRAAVRASTFAAFALIGAALVLIGCAVVFILATVGLVPDDHAVVPRVCLLIAAFGPLQATGSVLAGGAEFSRLEHAREWLRAQELLNARSLPYGGEPLTVIVEHSGAFIANPALAAKSTRPLPKHFDGVRRGLRVDPLRRGLGWILVPPAAAALAVALAVLPR